MNKAELYATEGLHGQRLVYWRGNWFQVYDHGGLEWLGEVVSLIARVQR